VINAPAKKIWIAGKTGNKIIFMGKHPIVVWPDGGLGLSVQ
jgi:hypothetical protein